jgi:uncharacterized LabA/DUF88 family protein
MRVTFLIDGFNLYHSILDAQDDTGINCKWLDVKSLMNQYLEHIDKGAKVEEIYFFTALREHVRKFNPQTVKRHERYLKMLQSTGISVVKGRFKEGSSWCNKCKKEHRTYEEKETDVNIAVYLIELALLDKADAFVIVSGDTDLIPGIDVLNRQFNKKAYVIWPYKRKNDEFKTRVVGSFKMKKDTYSKHQFSDPYTFDGKSFNKPSHW